MYISAATMLGVERTHPEEHSYTEIVDAIRVHGAQAQADIEELWRRIAFSILITNIDDHLLNHGFLHETRDQWRLSPAFDMNPSPDRVRELKTWISEEAGPDATVEGLMSVIPYFRISPTRAQEILGEVERASRLAQEGPRYRDDGGRAGSIYRCFRASRTRSSTQSHRGDIVSI